MTVSNKLACAISRTKSHTRRMHETADNKARGRATGQMEGRAFFHSQVFRQITLREEICRELNGAAEASAHHGRSDASVESAHPFCAVDLSQSIICIPVPVLRADREERRVGLEASLY